MQWRSVAAVLAPCPRRTVLWLLLVTAAAPVWPESVAPGTYDAIAAARTSIDNGKPGEAIKILDALLAGVQGKPYEQALVIQMLGYAQAGAGDLESATKSFRQALASGRLPESDLRNLRYNLAQILINGGQYKEGLEFLETWLKGTKSPTRDAHALAAVAYQRTGNCRAAVPHLDALAKTSDKDREKWSQALLACQVDAGQFDLAARSLEARVRGNPDDTDAWLQLAAAYQRSKQIDKSIAVMELLHERGTLNADQILYLARLYASGKVPLKAARLLQDEMDAGRLPRVRSTQQLLVDSLVMAKELEQAAVVIAAMLHEEQDAELYHQLGRIYFDLQKWAEASVALQKAVQSQSIKDVNGANLLLGIAAMQTREVAIAEQSLRIAAGGEGTREQAEWWLQRLRRQREAQSDADELPRI